MSVVRRDRAAVATGIVWVLLGLGCGDGGASTESTADLAAQASAYATESTRRNEALLADSGYQTRKRRIENFRRQGQTRQARTEAETALETDPVARDPWETMSRLAAGAQAVKIFSDLTERYPDNAHAWIYRAHHEVLTGRWAEAEVSLGRALEINPVYPEANHRLGIVLSTVGEFGRAADAFERSYRIAPRSSERAVLLARTLRIAGEVDRADAIVADALRHNPNSADLHFLAGLSLLRARNYEAAEASLRKSIALAPDQDPAHRELASLLQRDGREVEAREHLELADRLKDYGEMGTSLEERMRVLNRDPRLPLLRGELSLTLGRVEEAMEWLSRSASLGGPDVRIRAAMACVRFELGDSNGGAAELAGLESVDDPFLDLARAVAALDRGDADAATALLDRALERGPDERCFMRRVSDVYERAGREDLARDTRRRAHTAALL